MASPPSIGVIVASQRSPRVGLQIASFVLRTLQPCAAASGLHLQLIDLATWQLPLFDEPLIPSQVHSSTGYAHAHSRAWSAEVTAHAAFVFVTPQYNWGYPASVKNAIDYLFHEWAGKPTAVVSYGSRGGIKAAEQLRQVLLGVRMRVAETMPALAFPDGEVAARAFRGEALLLQGPDAIWKEERGEVKRAFEELMELLQPGEKVPHV
jgi:NAD(P)H-dependent FMN reductase